MDVDKLEKRLAEIYCNLSYTYFSDSACGLYFKEVFGACEATLKELKEHKEIIQKVIDKNQDFNEGYFVFVDRESFCKLKDLCK